MDNNANKYQKQIVTIPNALSFIRLCLIPVMVWLYVERRDHLLTLAVLMLSGVTDLVDGYIARKWNMVSDFGKAFDPVADKLTQIAMLLCLVSRFPYMIYPFLVLVIKEVCSGITSLVSIKRTNVVKSAEWHGKLTTAVVYAMMGLHLLWFDIPRGLSMITVWVCIGVMLMSFAMYTARNFRAIKNTDRDD